MPLSDYIERNMVSKRFILALVVIGYFAFSGQGGGIAGTVIGYYFGSKAIKA